MAYELRDKEYTTLEDMQKGAVNIEENLIEKRAKLRSEKRVTYRDDNVASTSDPNNERMCRGVEEMKQMIKKMAVTVSNLSKNQNQNQNFRRNNNTPNRQKESD